MVWLNLDSWGPPNRFLGLELSVIRPLNIVNDVRNFRSTKYNILCHLRLQLGIQLSDVALNLRVDHYLGWTLAYST